MTEPQERYHEWILRMLREERENSANPDDPAALDNKADAEQKEGKL